MNSVRRSLPRALRDLLAPRKRVGDPSQNQVNAVTRPAAIELILVESEHWSSARAALQRCHGTLQNLPPATLGLWGDGDEIAAIEEVEERFGVKLDTSTAASWLTVGDVFAALQRANRRVRIKRRRHG